MQSNNLKIIFFLFSLLAAFPINSSPLALDLRMLEPLKNNPNISSYKIHKIDTNTVIVEGKLNDGNELKIRLSGGNVLSKSCQKIIPSTKPDLTQRDYWLNQAFLFATQVWHKNDATFFKQAIENHKFVIIPTAKNELKFEEYNEGGYKSIHIVQSNQETVITLQQSAC